MEDLEVANQVLKDEIVALKVELKAQKEHDETEKDAIREALRDKILELEIEVSTLKEIADKYETVATQRDLLQIEVSEQQHRIATQHEEIANLRDAINGMADDMGQLEYLLEEYKGING